MVVALSPSSALLPVARWAGALSEQKKQGGDGEEGSLEEDFMPSDFSTVCHLLAASLLGRVQLSRLNPLGPSQHKGWRGLLHDLMPHSQCSSEQQCLAVFFENISRVSCSFHKARRHRGWVVVLTDCLPQDKGGPEGLFSMLLAFTVESRILP